MIFICDFCGSSFERKRDRGFINTYCSTDCKKSHDKVRVDTNRTTHGMSDTGVYRSYYAMLTRCKSKSPENYNIYGSRGITVCDDWLESFDNFYRDMGDRPEGKSLDRIDNDKGYYKGNCRWATASEQVYNRRPYSKSGVRGLRFHKGKWNCHKQIDGKSKHLGCFSDRGEAVNKLIEEGVIPAGEY